MKYYILNRPDRVAQLEEHWASTAKVVGSIHTLARHIFRAYPVWKYTQSNITSIIFSKIVVCSHPQDQYNSVNLQMQLL